MCVCVCIFLLQIRSTPISPGLLSLAMLMFKRPSRGLLLRLSRPPLLHDNDESNHTALTNW